MEYVRFKDVEDINLKDWLLKQGFTKVKVLQEGRKYAFPSLFSSDDKKWRFSVSLLDNGVGFAYLGQICNIMGGIFPL